ncbi:MAG: efflux RND transporter periplasmic adaptor subunit [Elusimicrobia bacterium]|nr:efflux RND transporter periplasmic adaptor subunit [Elusimicrobiota bacterium]MDE2425585.1 efflux RND transporter periplasmic adaptor subunit [Elusimicrobiota bacterium]
MKRIPIVLAVALLGLSACARRNASSDSGGAKGGRKILFYRSPMDPKQTSPAPAKDSMGMDFVPVYADEQAASEEPGSFRVPEGRLQLIGVKTEPAERRELIRTIRTVGRIAYDPELYRTQEEYLAALSAERKARGSSLADSDRRARSLLGSSRLRLRLLGLTDEQIDALGASGKPDAGLLLSSGKGGALWLYADVYESDLPWVRAGQSVEASAEALPGEVFRGAISSIDPVLDPKTRSARARIKVSDPGGLLRPGMYLDADIRVDLGRRLAISRAAVVDTGLRQVVFIDRGGGLLVARQVELGARSDDWVEARKGISEGDRVVTSGNFLIDSESNLKQALAGMDQAAP